MRQSKGFVFSIDALLAVVLLMMVLVAVAFFSSYAADSPFPMLAMQKQAGDVLIVLDKTGELGRMDPSELEASINNTLVPSLSWNMEMEYYNRSGGMMHLGNFSFGQDYSEADRIVLSERMFLVFDEEGGYGTAKKVKHYGIARLRLWAE